MLPQCNIRFSVEQNKQNKQNKQNTTESATEYRLQLGSIILQILSSVSLVWITHINVTLGDRG